MAILTAHITQMNSQQSTLSQSQLPMNRLQQWAEQQAETGNKRKLFIIMQAIPIILELKQLGLYEFSEGGFDDLREIAKEILRAIDNTQLQNFRDNLEQQSLPLKELVLKDRKADFKKRADVFETYFSTANNELYDFLKTNPMTGNQCLAMDFYVYSHKQALNRFLYSIHQFCYKNELFMDVRPKKVWQRKKREKTSSQKSRNHYQKRKKKRFFCLKTIQQITRKSLQKPNEISLFEYILMKRTE